MKSITLKSIAILSTTIYLLTGCANSPSLADGNLPSWVVSPEMKSHYIGIGTAEQNSINDFSAQRDEAMLIARNNLRKKIESDIVSGENKNIKIEAGKAVTSEYSQKIASRVNGKVKNAKVEDTWLNPKTNRLYIRMSVDK